MEFDDLEEAGKGRLSKVDCRPGCGACCVVPSISSEILGMHSGKGAFTPCVHLDLLTRTCDIWMTSDYPAVCRNFTPGAHYCGKSKDAAFYLLTEVEQLLAPESS